MFLAQRVERRTNKDDNIGYAHVVYRVIIKGDRPVWRTHSTSLIYVYLNAEEVRTRCEVYDVPFMPSPNHGKKVSITEASRLTGLVGPAALDRLYELVSESPDSPVLQNYVKPPKVKEPKPEPAPKAPPTKAELARQKLARADAKVQEWAAAQKHAEAKWKEWSRRAKRLAKRVEQLENEPVKD